MFSYLHSHWSRSKNVLLSLVKMLQSVSPPLLCHKETGQGIKRCHKDQDPSLTWKAESTGRKNVNFPNCENSGNFSSPKDWTLSAKVFTDKLAILEQ